jgi:pimeloyl-ACP methyl ester carboxylesterase
MPEVSTSTISLAADLDLTISEGGTGRPVVILHGGGGPFTVAPLVAHFAGGFRALAPTHPGWNGSPRPARLGSIHQLSTVYLDWLGASGLQDVLLVGNSLGGWIAADMAASDRAGLVGGIVIIDGTGILVPSEPMPDFFALTPREITEHSFADPDRFFVDPATAAAAQIANQKANMETMRALAGDPYMHDPALRERLADIQVPALVLWGEADRIVTPAYGRAFAAAIPGATFEVLEHAGHLPQIEQPSATFAAIDQWMGSLAD